MSNEIAQIFNRLSVFFRLLIMLVCVVMIVLAMTLWWIEPVWESSNHNAKALVSVRGKMRKLQSRALEARALFSDRLVDAHQAVESMHMVLFPSSGVRLVNIKKLPAKELSRQLYEHPFEVHFRADYFSMLDYLKDLQDKAPYFFWQKIDYKVTHYPEANIKLFFSSLSREAHWYHVQLPTNVDDKDEET